MAVVWVELGGGEGGAVVCVEGGGGEGRAGKTGDTTGLGVTELMGDSGRATCEVQTATVTQLLPLQEHHEPREER